MSNVTDIHSMQPRTTSPGCDFLESRLEDFGFRQDEFGIWRFRGWCDISIYACCGEWEIDVNSCNGGFACDSNEIHVAPNGNGPGAA